MSDSDPTEAPTLPPVDAATAASAAASATVLGPAMDGVATFYDADGTGNCSFPASPQDLFVVAPNKSRWYAGSALCGACMRVTGARGAVVVRVVDSCPLGAEPGDCGESGADLDLSAQAFSAIDDPNKGKVHVTFELVACPISGPMRYHFKPSSSQWWTAIQVENHRFPIAKLEVQSTTGWVELPRSDDDFFTAQNGVGPTPNGLTLRVTSSTGEVVQETLPGVADGKTFTGTRQFP
jgi:expansin (peptidoglycan-binding protein)